MERSEGRSVVAQGNKKFWMGCGGDLKNMTGLLREKKGGGERKSAITELCSRGKGRGVGQRKEGMDGRGKSA